MIAITMMNMNNLLLLKPRIVVAFVLPLVIITYAIYQQVSNSFDYANNNYGNNNILVDDYSASIHHLMIDLVQTKKSKTIRSSRIVENNANDNKKSSKKRIAGGGADDPDATTSSSGGATKKDVTATTTSENQLLPRPMQLLRDGIPLQTEYKYKNALKTRLKNGQITAECSCQNPTSTFDECCKRRIMRTHKMGCVMTKDLFESYGPQVRRVTEPHSYTYTKGLPKQDFRDVLVLRDLYDAIVSGYLYHIDGRECWKTGKGELIVEGQHDINTYSMKPYLRTWYEHLSYDISSIRNNRSMCQYMATESQEIGMRAYVDWVFNFYYSGPLSHWTLSQQFPYLNDRIMTICYNDFKSDRTDLASINKALTFWYNGTSNYTPWETTGAQRPGKSDAGGHATSKDQALRERLIQTIKLIDSKYYNGQIEYANSILPCQNIKNTISRVKAELSR